MKNILLPIIILFAAFSCGDKDDNAKPEDPIFISIVTPTSGQVITNNGDSPITVKLEGDIKKVEYFLDGTSIGAVISAPYNLKWFPINVDGGDHILTAIATSESNTEAKSEQKIKTKLNLGDEFKGGRIFHLTGENSGLIASTKDLQVGTTVTFTWGNQSTHLGTDRSNGIDNTKKMSQASTSDGQAAFYFKNGYSYNGFNDWYIPSFDEINILKENKDHVGGFQSRSQEATYWTSSELSMTHAHIQNMIALIGTQQLKGMYAYRIRPIRKF